MLRAYSLLVGIKVYEISGTYIDGADAESLAAVIQEPCFSIVPTLRSLSGPCSLLGGNPADVVGQSGRHTHELRPCTEKGSRSMAVERLDVNGPVPASADDLSQSLRVVLICLVDLHLKAARACLATRHTTSN